MPYCGAVIDQIMRAAILEVKYSLRGLLVSGCPQVNGKCLTSYILAENNRRLTYTADLMPTRNQNPKFSNWIWYVYKQISYTDLNQNAGFRAARIHAVMLLYFISVYHLQNTERPLSRPLELERAFNLFCISFVFLKDINHVIQMRIGLRVPLIATVCDS